MTISNNKEFPGDWLVLGMEDFETAAAREPGILGFDLMAQVRNNGRLLDHFRIAIGGSQPVSVAFNTRDVYMGSSVPQVALSW